MYRILAYFRHRQLAQARQGVHAAFMYRFIQGVLRDEEQTPLLEKLKDFFDEDNVLLLDEKYPGKWAEAYSKALGNMRSTTVVVIPKIHRTKHHTAAWETLRFRSEVKMSIDLFKYGLLLYRDEFKEKEHFFLKYPY